MVCGFMPTPFLIGGLYMGLALYTFGVILITIGVFTLIDTFIASELVIIGIVIFFASLVAGMISVLDGIRIMNKKYRDK